MFKKKERIDRFLLNLEHSEREREEKSFFVQTCIGNKFNRTITRRMPIGEVGLVNKFSKDVKIVANRIVEGLI